MEYNYAAKMYDDYFRDLIRDIVRQFPDNSKDTLEAELAYFREGLEKKQVGFLIERIFNEHVFYQCLDQEKNTLGSKESQNYCPVDLAVADFKSIRAKRKNSKNSEDIVWTLQSRGAKYLSQKEIQIGDGNSHNRFPYLLKQLDFSDRGQQLFYNSQEQCLWFNGLVDNGRTVYSQKYQGNDSIFLNALKKSNLQQMHNKLQILLKLYTKNQKYKFKREMVVRDMLIVARYLSDLIPIIDENSQLKNKEQLQEERMEVRQAVLKKFLMQKDRNREAEGERLKVILLRYFEDYALVEALTEEFCDIERISDEQIFVVTGEYLSILWQDMEELKEKVRHYNYGSVLKELQSKRYPIQVYNDMWKEAWSDSPENR